MEFFIGDDVEEESRRKRLREIRVITRLTGVEKDEHIAASVNGTQMREVERRQTQEPFVNQYPGTWAEEKGGVIVEWESSTPPFRKGRNMIALKPGASARGCVSSALQELWVWVRYR